MDRLKYAFLGNTGLKVSVLCLGSLAIGPLQHGLSPEDARGLLDKALELGVNFFDTSEFYGTYEHLRFLKDVPGTVVSSRSYAWTYKDMKASVERARNELQRNTIEIFGLHEQESGLTLKGHSEALAYLKEAREKSIIKAISVSTHYVQCVRAAAMIPEIDVIFAMLNVGGLGIRDGTRRDMEKALEFAKYMGKGVYLMKVLGGGHLFRDVLSALEYARDFPYKDSVAVGVKDEEELRLASMVLSGEGEEAEVLRLLEKTKRSKRLLLVEDYCEGCGRCVEVCPFQALALKDGKARVNRGLCMLCGYCARVCPHFCLKVV